MSAEAHTDREGYQQDEHEDYQESKVFTAQYSTVQIGAEAANGCFVSHAETIPRGYMPASSQNNGGLKSRDGSVLNLHAKGSVCNFRELQVREAIIR